MGKRKSKKNEGGGASKNAVDAEIVRSHMVTGSTTTLVKSDMTMKPQNFNIVQKPPRNFFTQTFWAQLTAADSAVTTASSAITETNYYFAISNFNGGSNYLSAFDQYCIYSVIATFSYGSENATILSNNSNVRVHTALDYDNVVNIGLPSLQTFSTYEAATIAPNTSLMRYVKPCLASYQYNGTSPVSSGVQRQWCDSTSPGIQHYGVRVIMGPTPAGTLNIIHSFTAVCGFRNGI